MRFDFPVDYPAEQINYINFFLRLQSPVQGNIQARAFFDSPEGEELKPVFLHGEGNELISPFSGFVPFLVPDGHQDPMRNCTLILQPLNENMPFSCTVYSVMINKKVGGIHFVSGKEISYTYKQEALQENCEEEALIPFVVVDDVETVQTTVEDHRWVTVDLTCAQSEEYLFLHQRWEENDVCDDLACELFIPKNHYLPGEPIVATYRNVYPKNNLMNSTVDLMFYMEQDRPGIDNSRDYVTLMFRDYNKGSAGSLVMPAEGARKYTDYLPGNYSVHLMQHYRDLCEPRKYTVSRESRVDALNAPLPGASFFIHIGSIPTTLKIYTEHPEGLTLWRFRCISPVVKDLEQRLYRMADISEHIKALQTCTTVTSSVRKSVLLQFLQTAYVRKRISAARYTKGDLPDALCRKMLSFIEDNLCNNINIKMLMEEFHCSESFLSHYFTKNMHMSFSSYISQAKIMRSKQWLIAGTKTISEIAELLNYSDVQAFSHAFKRIEGISPTTFRRLRTKGKNTETHI